MAAGVHLGHLSIESKNTGLELVLSSSARYTASDEDDIEEIQSRLTASQLSDDKQYPWFQSGGSILLRISLQIEGRPSAAERDFVIETFSTQLRTALVYHFCPPRCGQH
jgi:hypothetical protein